MAATVGLCFNKGGMLIGILDEVLKAGSGLLSSLRGRPNLPLKVQI